MVTSRNITWPRSTMVGFDSIWEELDRHLHGAQQTIQAFPKHNIVKLDDGTYLIELALAGYSREDLQVELKKGTLTITGDKSEEKLVEFIHKGISSKKFTRSFRLNENIIVKGSLFVDGILSISLELEVPEEHKPRLIDIQ